MAIVYLHKRKNDGEVFYVGIGKSKKRAYDKQHRSEFWKSYTNKHEYFIEILSENISWEEACEAEKELISFYGRKDLGFEFLVNLTDGGDGLLGFKHSNDTKLKMSKSSPRLKNWLGKTHSIDFKRKVSKAVLQYDLQGNFVAEYFGVREAARKMKVDKECIRRVCIGVKKSSCGYIWKYKENNK